MRFTLNIDCNGAAFTHVTNDEDNGKPNPEPEVARMLREAADKIESGRMGDALRDHNGKVTGYFKFDED